MGSEHINALRVGAVVEEYRIERLLGHGGFGMTYLARDLNLNTLVAIKEYLPQEFAVRAANSTIVPKSANDEQGYTWGLERFKQEARALARFKHPHIVRASRLIEANGTAYMVMDYEHGLTLGDYLKKHGPTLDEARILGVFLPILDGIHALHKAELVHRDIKPGNIYIRAEGGPMLIDFGAVRQAIGAHSRSLTAVVTPGFAPIEQYSSEGKQGPWTDLYAVGATMYTCILGRSPVDAARRSAAISDGDADPLVSAARIGKGKYSDQLLAAIDWALQFRTRDRPQTAIDFKETLKKSPVRPEQLAFEEEDGDKTAMGAVPREPWAEQAANSGSRSKPVRAAEPATQLSEPRKQSQGGPSGGPSRPPQGKMIPSGDADVASAPMEWFDPPPAGSANPPSKPKAMKTAPQAPRGQPTKDPDQDPLAQSNAGLIAAASAGEAKPKPAAPERIAEARKAEKPVAKPAPAKAAGGGIVANASARSTPPSSKGTALKVAAAVLVLGAAGAGLYWYQSGATDRRDAKLWAAAGRSGSVAGYQSYLAGCEKCAKRQDAEAAIAQLEEAAKAEAATDAQMQAIAELKSRFAQHVMAGEIDQPAGDNARTVLEELGKLAPDDVFVISGRERLALMERERRQARTAPAPAAAPAQAPTKDAAVAAVPAAKDAKSAATAGTKAGKDAKGAPTKPAPTAAAAPVAPAIDKDALLWDLLAKFEIALANKDIDGGPKSASVSLLALETMAPGDMMVRDARKRYDAIKAKADAAAARAAAAPAVVAPPVVTAPAVSAPVASTPAAAPPPVVQAPAQAAPAATSQAPTAASSTPAPPAGTTVRDALGPLGSGPPLIVVPAGQFRMGDLQGVGTPDEQPPTAQRMKSFAIAKREITVSQFRLFADTTRYVTDAERGGGCRVMKDGAWSRDARSSWRNPPFTQTDEEPVVCVSAADAGAYAAWLAQVTGGKYRLPTEAEWEYAARAGTESAWWWGASPTAGQANCEGCEGRTRPRTLEVGGFGKNAWGLFDTAGNVWEWTCSAYSPRLGGGETQCVNLKSENQIVMRGGSWATPVDRLRSSVRGYAAMSYASDNVGFRVAREY